MEYFSAKKRKKKELRTHVTILTDFKSIMEMPDIKNYMLYDLTLTKF